MTHNGIPESLEQSHFLGQNPAVFHRTSDSMRATGTSPGRNLASAVDCSGDAALQETSTEPKSTKENNATASFPGRETIEMLVQDCAGQVITQFPQRTLAVTVQYRTAANLQLLKQIGASNPEGFYYSLTANNKYSLFHIQQASVSTGVSPVWGDAFFAAICEHFDISYFAASSLSMPYHMIKKLALPLEANITPRQCAAYDSVVVWGKPVQDNKMPVSKECLIELCNVADIIFTGYDALLPKVLFLAAWGRYMRISEYTLEKKPRYCDHNLDACSVDILDDEDGLGITFKSDKASTWMSQLRHCVVAWSFCQRGQKKSLKNT